jgi:hypothetical protein
MIKTTLGLNLKSWLSGLLLNAKHARTTKQWANIGPAWLRLSRTRKCMVILSPNSLKGPLCKGNKLSFLSPLPRRRRARRAQRIAHSTQREAVTAARKPTERLGLQPVTTPERQQENYLAPTIDIFHHDYNAQATHSSIFSVDVMNSDATEAALGLLGLSPYNAPNSHPQPQPHSHHHVAHPHGPSLTSSSVGIAVYRTSTPPCRPVPAPLVPLKRKHPSPALSAITATPPLPSTSTDALSAKSKQPSHPLATPPIISNHPLPNLSTKSLPAPSQRLPQQRPFSPTLSTFLPPQTSPTSQHSLASPPPPPIIHSLSLIYLFQTRTPSRASVDSLMTMVLPSHVTTVHDGAMASFKGGRYLRFGNVGYAIPRWSSG